MQGVDSDSQVLSLVELNGVRWLLDEQVAVGAELYAVQAAARPGRELVLSHVVCSSNVGIRRDSGL